MRTLTMLGISVLFTANLALAENLVIDPDFDDSSLANWQKPPIWTRWPFGSPDPDSLQIVATAGTATQAVQCIPIVGPSVDFFVRSVPVASGSVKAQLLFYDTCLGAVKGVADATFDPVRSALTGGWQVLGVQGAIAPPSAGAMQVTLTADATASATAVVADFDHVQVGLTGTVNADPWTSRVSGTTHYLRAVASSPTQFVTVGESGVILASSDGASWTVGASGTSSYLNGVAFGKGQFVAVGVGGLIITSSDGIHWNSRSSGTTNSLNAITWTGTQFVAVGNNGDIRTSLDGTNWNSRTSGTANPLLGVASNGALTVAVGFSSTILVSKDVGASWTTDTFGPAVNFSAVTVQPDNLFWAVGLGGLSFYSSDGVNWSSVSPGSADDLYAVASNQLQVIAAGADGSISSYNVATSGFAGQGKTTPVSLSTPPLHDALHGITWSQGLFVAVGEDGTILTQSTDELFYSEFEK